MHPDNGRPIYAVLRLNSLKVNESTPGKIRFSTGFCE
jgi:hypothetical protein